MFDTTKIVSTMGAAGLALMALTGNVAAADLGGSIKDAPAPAAEERKFAFSWNIAGTSDYIFRGYSQSARDPAWQLGADISYGIFYAGVWSSRIDFGNDNGVPGTNIATAEVDLYAGIKPVWGPATFDFGVIYYAYPNAKDGTGHSLQELDYVELKGGVSGSFIPALDKLTLGYTAFYTWEGTNKTGAILTNEFTAAYELPKMWIFTPTIGGTLGYQIGFDDVYKTKLVANGADSYLYWNVGLALAVDKLTLDFRYWDTDVSNAGNFCHGTTFQCSGTFVFTAKLTF